MKVVIAEPLGEQLHNLLSRSDLEWEAYQDVAKSKRELIKRIGNAEVVAGWSIKIDQEVFEACPNLKFIAVAAVGAGTAVDMKEAQKRGVTVMNCPGYNAGSVAEFAVMLALLARKQVQSVIAALQKGEWQVHGYRKHVTGNMTGLNIVIIGYGNVGSRIHELIKPWNVSVTKISSKSSDEQIDSACENADVVFVCCSLNDRTVGLLNKQRIELIGPRGTIVNVSRGAIIDEDALYRALESKQLASAALDVFIDEPFNDGPVPSSINRFAKLPNVVCSPHIAGMSTASSENLGLMLFENIQSCIDGSPKHIYN
jgi:phosphoglycerate dehydrogenase-like enzyme